MSDRRGGPMVRPASLLTSVFQDIPGKPPSLAVAFAQIVELWPNLVNSEWAKATQPQGIRNGVLRVACASSGLALNLRFEGINLVKAIQERVPAAGVMRLVPYFGNPIGVKSWDTIRGKNAREPEQPLLRDPEPATLEERIQRARGKQKAWVEHMKKAGWKGCPVCRKIPIQVTSSMCALCEHKRRRRAHARSAT